MFINTYSSTTMQKDICTFLKINESDLFYFFRKTYKQLLLNRNENELSNLIKSFIKNHLSENKIDKVLFFHLTRRLNSNDPIIHSYNLYHLLSTKNIFSEFLAKHNITFKPVANYLEIYYKNKFISLEDKFSNSANRLYFKSRLGYNKDCFQDFCINGFMFKDTIYKNFYANSLSPAPEIITKLSYLLDIQNLTEDYMENSTYYLFEYLIPIDDIIFSNYTSLKEDKTLYFIELIIKRLYLYYFYGSDEITGSDNEILRLSENVNLDETYFVKYEKITSDILK